MLGAAAGIALVMVAARVVGFGRVAVLSRTLGTSCVGDTYSAANYVPNIVFEIVAGGALASLVVPVLAGAVAKGDRSQASRTASALLTWTVVILVPVALLGALCAPLLMRALLGDDPTCAGAVATGSRMLVVFMPQVVLYGTGLAAQQVALVVALRLAAGGPAEGSVIVFTVATALFLLPWAVLAVPVATSVFPGLSASAEAGQTLAYTELSSRSVRTVLLAMTGAAAVLAVVAAPVARLLVRGVPGPESSAALAEATAAFAPGLVGYGLLALLARALYARGDGRTPAVATVLGWLAVGVADLALVAGLPDADRVVLLGIGNTIGVSLAGGLLLLGLRRAAGPAALTGAGRSGAAGLAGAGLIVALASLVPAPGATPLADLLAAAGTALAAALVFLLVVRLLDPAGLKGLLRA